MTEYVICGASLEDVCSGELPPEELRKAVNAAFRPDWQATGGYRVLTRMQGSGEDEIDLTDDGTYRAAPESDRIAMGDVVIDGAVICDACYVTLCVLSPSGAGLNHELQAAIEKARSMDPGDLPRIRGGD